MKSEKENDEMSKSTKKKRQLFCFYLTFLHFIFLNHACGVHSWQIPKVCVISSFSKRENVLTFVNMS